MTLLLGIHDGDSSWALCDSCIMQDDIKTSMPKGTTKIFQATEGVLIGACGYARDIDILLVHSKKLFPTKTELNVKTIISEIVPNIFRIFEENGRTKVDDEGIKCILSEIFIATKDGVWTIELDGNVNGSEFVAVGPVSSSLACHEVLQNYDLSPEKELLKIASAIFKIKFSVDYPLYLFHTESEMGCKFENEYDVEKYCREM